MAYTNNVPQATQQIATTQPLIQANFGFIDTGIGQEHNFNTAGSGIDMYHLQASMPNRGGGDPVALPAGTNGMYYVNGGVPKYYNGTVYFLPISQAQSKVLKGTAAITTAPTTVVTLPASSAGKIFVWDPTTFTSRGFYTSDFLSSTTGFASGPVLSSLFNQSASGLQFQLATINAAFNATYTYVVVIYT